MIYIRIISIRCDIQVHKTILMQPFIDLSSFTKTRQGTVMYVCQEYLFYLFFFDFPIKFWKCSNGELFFSYFVKYHTIYLLKLSCINSFRTCLIVNDKSTPFRHIMTLLGKLWIETYYLVIHIRIRFPRNNDRRLPVIALFLRL